MDNLKMHTPNKAEENYKKLAELFPNAVTETIDPATGEIVRAIDKDILMQEISSRVVEGRDERYQFTWPDKKKAILAANAPIAATLRPVKEESVGKDGTSGGWDSQNLYIEGDNLDVLKLLQETYLGKIKMIYIDPPYNTGKSFVYEDDFAEDTNEYIARSGQFDDQGNRLEQNTESNGRFHTDWLNMIYSRLKIAKSLLSENGLLFISIDDNELINLTKIGYEVFGEKNFLACFPRITKKAGKTTEAVAKNNDYVIAFSKSNNYKIILPFHTDEGFKYSDEYESDRGKYKLNQTLDYDSLQYSSSLDYPITINGEVFYPGSSKEKYEERKRGIYSRADWAWRWSKDLFDFGYQNGFIVIKRSPDGKSRIYTKTYQNATIQKIGSNYNVVYQERTRAISTLEFIDNEYSNDNSKKQLLKLFSSSVFDYSKPISLLNKLCCYATEKDDIILDFFSGSATTAHAVMQLNAEDGGNRKFIMVQLAEATDEKDEAYKAGYKNTCEIGKERIRRAGRKIKEEAGLTASDLDIGFRVLRLDSSNMQDVYYNPSAMTRDLLDATVDNIKIDRTPEDLLFQVMLDLGVELSSTIEERTIDGKQVFVVKPAGIDKEYLVACFDKEVTDDTVTAIAKMQPYYAVFRDSSMANDSVATNFDQIFETYSPQTVRKVL